MSPIARTLFTPFSGSIRGESEHGFAHWRWDSTNTITKAAWMHQHLGDQQQKHPILGGTAAAQLFTSKKQ
jgi:hypothetical protein